MEPDYTVKKLGAEVGESLQARLADLDAADCLADMPVGVDLASSTPSFIPIHLVHDHYLIARADHVEVYKADKSADAWDMVRRILLTDFQDMPR